MYGERIGLANRRFDCAQWKLEAEAIKKDKETSGSDKPVCGSPLPHPLESLRHR
jgi:hypothetical protein